MARDQEFGLGFITVARVGPRQARFRRARLHLRHRLTSFLALLIAGPPAIAIALFLTELAPRGIRGVVATLVELLAAIPSVVIGLWGIFVLGPFVKDHVGPVPQSWFGWLPFF